MKTFSVQFRYQDRSAGTVESTVSVDASNLPGAVAKATREFVKKLDRKQRFDMNKSGLEITAKPAEGHCAQNDNWSVVHVDSRTSRRVWHPAGADASAAFCAATEGADDSERDLWAKKAEAASPGKALRGRSACLE